MSETTIKLGDKNFPIKSLPINQLLELAGILEDETLGPSLKDGVERLTRIISLSLRFADPSMTEENVRVIPATIDELRDGVLEIRKLAGLGSGEAAPAAS
jgi:hypothetical protein